MGSRVLMRVEYQKCRTWGHAWEDFIPAPGSKRRAPWGERFCLRCERCGTERFDVFDSLGQLSTRHYDYAPDYELDIDERPSRENLRVSLARKVHQEELDLQAGIAVTKKLTAAKPKRPAAKKTAARHPRKGAGAQRHLRAVG